MQCLWVLEHSAPPPPPPPPTFRIKSQQTILGEMRSFSGELYI